MIHEIHDAPSMGSHGLASFLQHQNKFIDMVLIKFVVSKNRFFEASSNFF